MRILRIWRDAGLKLDGEINAARMIGMAFGVILMLSGVIVLLMRAIEGVVPLMIGLVIVLACSGTKERETSKITYPPPVTLPPAQRSPSTIQCPSCGHRNPKDHAFCGKCGTALVSQKEETRIYE